MFLNKLKFHKPANAYFTQNQLDALEDYIYENKKIYSAIKQQNYLNLDFTRNYDELDAMLDKIENTFGEYLIEIIAKSGETEIEIYKRANLDRRLFSKIKNKNKYHPSKNTVVALAMSLKLSSCDAKEFLGMAGYALSIGDEKDIILKYFFEKGIYDLDALNSILYEKNLTIL